MEDSKKIKYTIECDGEDVQIEVIVPEGAKLMDALFILSLGVSRILSSFAKEVEDVPEKSLVLMLSGFLLKQLEADKQGGKREK